MILSADATAGQIRRLQEAGAHAYLTKPIDVRELLEVIGGELDETASGRAGTAGPG